MKTLQIICAGLLFLLGCSQASAEDSRELVSALKQGGHVIVFRHGATDDDQKDIYPLNFEDMKAQRQLNEKGRDMARQIGTAIKKLGIPVGEVYTSRLNRAIDRQVAVRQGRETRRCVDGQRRGNRICDGEPPAAVTQRQASPCGSWSMPRPRPARTL